MKKPNAEEKLREAGQPLKIKKAIQKKGQSKLASLNIKNEFKLF